ncbi:type I-E CRISPR-associated protein Cse1/CasA [Desulfosudis oleivorans]|uniref:CRISPR-associated protein, Cse1 family n=1 Tax=Desulfosudis oleivorans (strain DSM 6200 / JCM 39069 / Hxd3) TaxID=96561 RepID=A8ZZ14_DESOH|nr:type I-E CRISPR-associated protein Cse1/CasA [Desulfosudis oleivorans]ABW68787.1 CRISPR-associated protein, Cse1 family [Desulfosudis oleivorans Hxd3]
MNLLTDKWIPVIRENGPDKIAPWQIVETENPVMEINAPRPDFQGALYQFFIGLLQTCFAPEDEDQWRQYWENMPKPDELKKVFEKNTIKKNFELYNPDGPAFMQDFDLSDGEEKHISFLLIEAPGGKTQKDNLDHFIKRGHVNSLCESCTASALFTLQLNAPAGGQGNRVGLRGGGPLTTLLVPEEANSNLWHKVWLNILNKEDNEEFFSPGPLDDSVLPWLGPTRISDKQGVATTPEDCHALQMYWGMPRRIRLRANEEKGNCDICGHPSNVLYKTYKAKNFGIDYVGAWVHPLTPYRFDTDHQKPPLSLKGQKGGLGYRHWLGLALQDTETGNKAATTVQFYNDERGPTLFNNQSAALWCFGFDMDNMKARCWYDTHFPVLILNKQQKENLIAWAVELIGSARATVKILRDAVKSAWFKRPGDAKGDMSAIDRQFWETTEPGFYKLLDDMAKLPSATRMAPPEIYANWFRMIKESMFDIFEKATLYNSPEEVDLKQIVSAKQSLTKTFYNNSVIKNLKAKAKEEVAQ